MIRGKKQSERWSVILAGGSGTRTKPMIEQWLGYHKPKQFCSFVGQRSMLQHTWDRADQLTFPHQKVTVVAQTFNQEVWSQFQDRRAGHVVVQPRDCGTAVGMFLPLTYVRARNPDATIVLYPSDHFVQPEGPFIDAVQRSLLAAEYLAERIILLGVVPTSLELEYGWIKPDHHLGWCAGSSVRAVRSFLEKPTRATAQAAMEDGALWNTLVLAAKVETLWNLGRRCFPDLMFLFDVLGQAIGTPEEGYVLTSLYQVMPTMDLSSDFLQQIPDHLGIIELRGISWSDWGRPERILKTLLEFGKAPKFQVAGIGSAIDSSEAVLPLLRAGIQ